MSTTTTVVGGARLLAARKRLHEEERLLAWYESAPAEHWERVAASSLKLSVRKAWEEAQERLARAEEAARGGEQGAQEELGAARERHSQVRAAAEDFLQGGERWKQDWKPYREGCVAWGSKRVAEARAHLQRLEAGAPAPC